MRMPENSGQIDFRELQKQLEVNTCPQPRVNLIYTDVPAYDHPARYWYEQAMSLQHALSSQEILNKNQYCQLKEKDLQLKKARDIINNLECKIENLKKSECKA